MHILQQEGLEVTQSTLSRDLSELGVTKRKGQYRFLEDPKDRWFQLGYRSALVAGPHLIVVKTDIGCAQRVGLLIDQAALPGVVGTLAGDDTIFVALDDAGAQSAVVTALEAGL